MYEPFSSLTAGSVAGLPVLVASTVEATETEAVGLVETASAAVAVVGGGSGGCGSWWCSIFTGLDLNFISSLCLSSKYYFDLVDGIASSMSRYYGGISLLWCSQNQSARVASPLPSAARFLRPTPPRLREGGEGTAVFSDSSTCARTRPRALNSRQCILRARVVARVPVGQPQSGARLRPR